MAFFLASIPIIFKDVSSILRTLKICLLKDFALFDSNNAKSLSKQILRVLNMDETSLKMMGIEARKNVTQRFNVEKMCFSTYSEYKRLLN